MASARVGDDVYGEDATTKQLEVLVLMMWIDDNFHDHHHTIIFSIIMRISQEQVAQLLGKEAGLFVPSGTMANLIAVR